MTKASQQWTFNLPISNLTCINTGFHTNHNQSTLSNFTATANLKYTTLSHPDYNIKR